MKINREKALAAFQEYTDRYDSSRDMIRLKIEHTYRVCGLCQQIARSLDLPEEETVTGLYNGLNHLYNDNYNTWFDCFSAVMDRDANWRNFGMLFGNQTTSGDGPSWIWHDNYKFIIRCNDVIANMPDVVGLPEAKKACPRKFRQMPESVSGIS